jgi:starch synthase
VPVSVLSIASEAFPLVKTGGLADVTGALPPALKRHDVETRTFLPGYPAVMKALRKGTPLVGYEDLGGGPAAIISGQAGGLDLFVLDAPHLYDRAGGLYADPTGADWPDNWLRFAALSRAGADLAQGIVAGYRPDVVHVHDWQAGLVPAYLRFWESAPPPAVITVHNIAFQGQFGAGIFPALGLPNYAFGIDGVEYYGGVGFLKAGLACADAITTVSPTYAQEIRTPAFGMGLQGLINTRADVLHGIVNGIDTEVWDPSADEHLASTYSAKSLKNRARNRRAVEERFRLHQEESPLLAVVSRLTWQKGMDVLASQADRIVAAGAKLAVLGSGEPGIEAALHLAAARHPGRVGLVIGYDEALSHLVQGGADVILVPSRFEPCGLTQLYGLRYACVPAVARTGGLNDTVIDANEAALTAGVATGFHFAPDNGDALFHAVTRISALHADEDAWTGLMRQGMKADLSWNRSAARYAALYRSLLRTPQA